MHGKIKIGIYFVILMILAPLVIEYAAKIIVWLIACFSCLGFICGATLGFINLFSTSGRQQNLDFLAELFSLNEESYIHVVLKYCGFLFLFFVGGFWTLAFLFFVVFGDDHLLTTVPTFLDSILSTFFDSYLDFLLGAVSIFKN